MSSDANFQPLLPNSNTQVLLPTSALSSGFSGIDEDQLDLSRILSLVRRRMLVIAGVGLAISSGIIAKTLGKTPQYQGKFQLLVEPVTGEQELDQLNQSLKTTVGIKADGLDYESQIEVLKSPQVMSPIIESIQARYPEFSYDTLQEKLTVAQLRETKILETRYQDSDPEKIKFVLEQVVKGYINYSEQEQQTTTRQGIQFVESQLPKLQERVNKFQEQLQRFRQQYNLTDPETQGKLLTSRLSTILEQRQETTTTLKETQELYSRLQTQLGLSTEQALAAATLSEAPRYQDLLNQLAEVERQIAMESARFTADSPTIEALEEQRQNLLPLLNQQVAKVVPNGTGIKSAEALGSPSSVRLNLIENLVNASNQMRVLEARQTAIANAEGQMNNNLENLAVISRQYTDLQRQLKVSTESLNRFLAVRETLEIESAQKTLPWQVIRKPQQPQEPISPNVPRGIVLGVVAGMLAGCGAGLLAEKLDRVFHTPDEIKEATGLPVLGTIPFRKELKKGFIAPVGDSISESEKAEFNNSYISSPFLEAFRSLQVNLHFLGTDESIRSLVISSTVPADGKSTVSSFLAQAAAAMGRRVLLVDADLRRPQVHVRMDLPNVWGLSNVITSEMDVDDVIQQSPMEENLFVLTAGQIPPDPTRLLSSQKMQNLVKHFQESFDLVLFDTPPMLGLADARLLEAHTDGMVMVVGLGRTDRSVFREVLSGLRTSRARVLGVVANGVKNYTTGPSNYYYRYYGQQNFRENQLGRATVSS